jgi:hypothetical protein
MELKLAIDNRISLSIPISLYREELQALHSVITSNLGSLRVDGGVKLYIDTDVITARKIAIQLLQMNRRRILDFGSMAAGNPCWHMLLDLFVQRCDKRKVSFSSACYAAGVPFSTASRNLKRMVKEGLVVAVPSENDQRVQYVEISPAAYDALQITLSDF